MDRVYESNGGYTEKAVDLDRQVRNLLRPLIQNEVEDNTPIEVISYILCNSIATEVLTQSLAARLNQKTCMEKERLIQSDEDCADCLCRVCARNSCNDSCNTQLEDGYANCSCNCNIGDKLIETEDDCSEFLPNED